jgi:hypothetical protein
MAPRFVPRRTEEKEAKARTMVDGWCHVVSPISTCKWQPSDQAMRTANGEGFAKIQKA